MIHTSFHKISSFFDHDYCNWYVRNQSIFVLQTLQYRVDRFVKIFFQIFFFFDFRFDMFDSISFTRFQIFRQIRRAYQKRKFLKFSTKEIRIMKRNAILNVRIERFQKKKRRQKINRLKKKIRLKQNRITRFQTRNALFVFVFFVFSSSQISLNDFLISIRKFIRFVDISTMFCAVVESEFAFSIVSKSINHDEIFIKTIKFEQISTQQSNFIKNTSNEEFYMFIQKFRNLFDCWINRFILLFLLDRIISRWLFDVVKSLFSNAKAEIFSCQRRSILFANHVEKIRFEIRLISNLRQI